MHTVGCAGVHGADVGQCEFGRPLGLLFPSFHLRFDDKPFLTYADVSGVPQPLPEAIPRTQWVTREQVSAFLQDRPTSGPRDNSSKVPLLRKPNECVAIGDEDRSGGSG